MQIWIFYVSTIAAASGGIGFFIGLGREESLALLRSDRGSKR